MKRTADDANLFAVEAKRTAEVITQLPVISAEESRSTWTKVMTETCGCSKVDIAQKIALRELAISTDPVFGFLGQGQPVLEALDRLKITITFALGFMHCFFPEECLARHEKETYMCDKLAALDSLYSINSWPVWAVFKAPRFPRTVPEWIRVLRELLEAAKLSAADLFDKEPDPKEYMGTSVSKLEACYESTWSSDPDTQQQRVFNQILGRTVTLGPRKATDTILARLHAALGEKSQVFIPSEFGEIAMKARHGAELQKLKAMPLRMPTTVDVKFLEYLKTLELTLPQIALAMLKRHLILDQLEFEMLEEKTLAGMLADAAGPLSAEDARLWSRDAIRLTNAHGKLNAWKQNPHKPATEPQ